MTIMDKYFICLANSYKHGGRCLAGIELTTNDKGKPVIVNNPDGRPHWIRPISDEKDGVIPNDIAKDIKLFSVIKLTDAVSCGQKPHVEDTKYSHLKYYNGRFRNNEELLKLCLDRKHQNLFYSQGKAISIERAQQLDYSLMFIHPDNVEAYIDEEREKSKYRMKFNYYGSSYDFSITDPVFLEEFKKDPDRFSQLKDVYLTLSLGLDFEGFHYKLVAAVIMPTHEEEDDNTTLLFNNNASRSVQASDDWFSKYEQELARLIELKKDTEEKIAALRKELIQQMEVHGAERVRSTRFTVSYTPPRCVMLFDSKLFKEENQELYASYCKPIQKEASIVVRRNNSVE